MRKILIFLLFISSLIQGQQAEVSLDTNAILIGEQTFLTFKVSSGESLNWLSFKNKKGEYDAPIENIEVLDVFAIDTTFEGSLPVYEQRILITSFDSGYYVFPPFNFPVDGTNDTLRTNPVLLSVNYPEIDVTENQEAKLADIKKQEDLPFEFRELYKYWWILLLVILLIGAIIAYRYYLKNRPVKEAKVVVETIPFHLTALSRLNKLKEEKLWQKGDYKAYYSEISSIVRWFIENRFKTLALESTTNEIITEIKSKLDPTELNNLKSLLELSDLAKFAKSTPVEADNVRTMKDAISFIESNKEVIIEE